MEIKKNILLIGHNFFPEPTGIGKYSGEMIEWLRQNEYPCTVITTYPYYPHWEVQLPYRNGWFKKEHFGLKDKLNLVTIYRCPLYVPKRLTGKQRILHDLSFTVSMLCVVLKCIVFDKKFDYIVVVAPPFHLGYLGLLYKKLRGGKLIYHIQDLQIEAAQSSDLLKGKKLFEILHKAEKILLRKSDIVSSISHGMINKIQSKLERKVTFFPNWVETKDFYKIENNTKIRKDWGINQTDFICLYSGSIGGKQGLENIINAAELLKHHNHIKFFICGTGPYKKLLEDLANKKELKNISFIPLVSKARFNDFLNLADLHLIIQKAYIGDLVMPSKLQTILAVGGVSLVTAEPGTSLYTLVEKFDVGYISKPDDYEDLANKILYASDKDNTKKSNNARNYALENLNIDRVMSRFLKDTDISKELNKSELLADIVD